MGYVRHPDDPDELPNTKEWRDEVRRIVDDPSNDWNLKKIGKAVGCEPTTMTKLMNGSIRSSELVRKISEVLRITHLEPFLVDAQRLEIINKILRLDDLGDLDFVRQAVDRTKNKTVH